MGSLNKILLIGNLTSDLDVKSTTNGTTMAKFSIAVDRPQGSTAPTSQTDFFNIVDDDYKIDNLINKNDICENCNIPFKIKNNECLLFCEKCGLLWKNRAF